MDGKAKQILTGAESFFFLIVGGFLEAERKFLNANQNGLCTYQFPF